MSAPSGPRRLRDSIGGLAVEAAMVVFAVLVALGIEEWRDDRELQEFAGRVESAVIAELRANLEEMRSTEAGLLAAQERLGRVLTEGDPALLADSLNLEIPDFSSAAWTAAQSSQAAPYLKYEWVLAVSRAHEAHALYGRIADRIIDAMGTFMAGRPTLESIAAVQGRLVVLNGVHGQVIERLEIALAVAR